jgi:ABC-type Mn2+/Zn2+ transport system ATPase subunit
VVSVNTAAAEMPTSPPSVISAVAVSKSWGDHQVFSDLTAEVPKGVTGLLGSNGSGKTTLLGMLLGLHNPDAGSLRVLGEDPAHAGPELRQLIGYSPEHHDLPDDVAAQDLVRHIAQVHGLPRREATTRSSDALWLVGLGEERLVNSGQVGPLEQRPVEERPKVAADRFLEQTGVVEQETQATPHIGGPGRPEPQHGGGPFSHQPIEQH